MNLPTGMALVTGANGFLGRHVVHRLIDLGIPVATMGRTESASPGISRHIAVTDVGDAARVRQAISQIEPVMVFHLAGNSGNADHQEVFRVNTVYGANLLDAVAGLAHPPRVLLAGSAAEYGVVTEAALPLSETSCCQPAGPYGISKLAQTQYGLAAANAGLPVVVARLFNIVGHGMPLHLALGSFADQIRAMPAHGGVLQTGPLDRERDFVEASSTAEVLVDLINNPAAFGQIVNICSGQPTSLRRYVEALIAISGKSIKLASSARPHPRGDMLRHWGANNRLRALGYRLPAADPVAIAQALTHLPAAR